MSTFTQYLGGDHQRCDALFALAEQAVHARADDASAAHGRFVEAMEHHFGLEEDLLFPAFESATGTRMGPTTVMRHEHEQMRQLFEQMSGDLTDGRYGDYLGAAESLLILMQQHNAKEEQMLYPMCDDALAYSRDNLLQDMRDRQ